MSRSSVYLLAAAAAFCTLLASSATAGIKVYEDGDKYVEIGGRIQIQYLATDGDLIESSDRIFFRRLRPYVMGSVTRNWDGKIQFDFGAAEDANEVAIKDAWMRYKGWKNHSIYIGNAKTTFSREFLTSSKRQQLVGRTFVGDHNFGSPDRQLGFRLDGTNGSKKLAYKLSLGAQHHDPDVRRMDFDTPVNNASDWNEGIVAAARIDFMPAGEMKYDQADFRSDETKYGFGLAAFSWSNDEDSNTYTDSTTGLSTSSSRADLDSATGFEVSFSVRGRGFSADADYNLVSGDTVDSAFTGGVYRNGTTDLEQVAVEGGYMFPNNLELVGGYETQDADNYVDTWNRTSVGVNYYLNKHKLKVQATYRMAENVFGQPGNDQDLLFVQFQFVF